MKVKTKIGFLLAILFLTCLSWPVSVQANFKSVNNNLVFSTNKNFYRLRSPAKNWQLAVEAPLKIKTAVTHNNWIYFVVTTEQGEDIWRTKEGIRFYPYNNYAQEWQLQIVGSHLLAARQQDGAFKAWQIIGDDMKMIDLDIIGLGENAGFYDQDNSLFYLELKENQVRWWKINRNIGELVLAKGCPKGKILNSAKPSFSCGDRQIFELQNKQDNLLFEKDFSLIKSNNQIIALLEKDAPILTILDETDINSFELTSRPQDIILFGRRVLLKSDKIYELDWAKKRLDQLTDLDNRVIAADNQEESLFISGSESFMSTQPLEKTQVSYQGNFNHAWFSSLGWFLYQVNKERTAGGLAQFAPTGQTVFTKVNPWSSTTSPIQAIESYQGIYLVYVITDSGRGNVNLYQSVDMTKWSRVSLPTNPTYFVSIASIRNLPSGTSVIAEGVVMVQPSVVSDEIIYLFDDSAGIQVFLSSSKGALPKLANYRAQISGEISSSQTKRIILDQLDDLVMGPPQTVKIEKMSLSLAAQSLARLAEIEGKIKTISHPSLILADDGNSQFKVRFNLLTKKLSDIYSKEDKITGKVIIDWSSASQSIEGWSLEEQFKLMKESPDQAVPPTPTPAPAKANATDSSNFKNVKPSPKISPSSANQQLALASARQVTRPSSKSKPTLTTQTQSSPESNEPPFLLLPSASLIAALLAMRGFRLKSFLSAS